MKNESKYINNGFRKIELKVEHDHVGEVLSRLLEDDLYMYMFDDIQVQSNFYSGYYGRPHRTIKFLTRKEYADEVLSRCIGQDFVIDCKSWIPT